MVVILLILQLLPNSIVPARQAAADTWIDVSNPAGLAAINTDATSLQGSYRLTQDINLALYDNGDHKGWLPIGNNGTPFTGKLDGNGFTIRNMTINRPNSNYVGFFGSATNAEITNLHLTGIQVVGHSYVGGIAGTLITSTLTKSYAEGSVTGNAVVGVAVGYNDNTNISDGYAQGTVIVAAATPTPAPNEDSYGGLIGYSSGSHMSSSGSGKITNSYSTVAVGTGVLSGGLIGDKAGIAAVTSSYWNTVTSGRNTSAGGSGKTTAEMKRKATYVGWDFTNTWGLIEEATYPLQRSDYLKVALASLTVEDAAHAPQALNRAFSSDYGSYSVQVVSKTDHVTVTGTAVTGTSTISVDGGSSTQSLALNPGKNDFQIKVSDSADPTRLNAVYKLTVYRDAGTAQYPHRISTANQLSKIGDAGEGYGMGQAYELDANLDLSAFGAGLGWLPIGSNVTPFTGSFDGKNHTVSGLTINRTGADHVGLFGKTSGATVTNMALLDTDIHGHNLTGGLIGEAENSTVSGISVQGAVYGNDTVGGLIGGTDASSSLSESYSAAYVGGTANTGGLIGSNVGGTVTASFWDTASSSQTDSAGGTGLSTQQMMKRSSFTSAGWAFGSGNRWGIIEGTTYPMPFSSFGGVLLNTMAVTATGATVSMNPSFDNEKGLYVATLNHPVASAKVSISKADAGASVSINGIAGSTADIALRLGNNNPVEIRVTGADGLWQGVYRLTIAVPTPQPSAIQLPADGTYKVGQQLNFTFVYDQSVDVTGTPTLPLHLNSSDAVAVYTGSPLGHPEKLQFSYTIQSGDLDMDGLELGDALEAISPGTTITALGENVTLDMPSPLPDMSGIHIDGISPTIGLTPSTTAPTNGAVAVTVAADGTGTTVANLKWAFGVQDAVYFASAGTTVVGSVFIANSNGTYTVYARDGAGNEKIETIDIMNITTESPTLLLDYTPKGLVRNGVDVTVTAAVYDGIADNVLEALKWAEGERIAADFANPTFGTDILATEIFHAVSNGKYTVYALDSAGNEQIETIEIANIITESPTLSLDYTPKELVRNGVDVTVTASVYDGAAGNVLAALKWAEGERTAADFANPTFGTDILAAGVFHVTRNGKYTVYAADSVGNEQVGMIEIANISAAPNTPVTTDIPKPSPIPGLFQFSIGPGQEYNLKMDGLELHIPIGAIEQAMTISMMNVTGDAQKSVEQGQLLLSGIYQLTKDVPGKFKAPVLLSIELTGGKWSANQRPTLVYYDEAAAKWVEIGGGKVNGNVLSGQTDHFTKFAVMTVPTEPKPEVEPTVILTDVAGHWAEHEIREGIAQGLIDGYPDGTFHPDSPVSRAEFALMLKRALAWTDGTGLFFEDKAGIPAWASGAVSAAVQAGVINGYPDHTFRPNASINRVETVVMIAKAAGLQASSAPDTAFADNDAIAKWALPYVDAASEAGIIRGQDGNKFNPLLPTTRAEAVVLLLRLIAFLQTSNH
ncbi:unnamed protein product [Aphanomyces euteiches]